MEYIFLVFIAELLEVSWQKGNNLKEIMLYNYQVYRKGIFKYLSLHFGFLMVLGYAIIFQNYNFWIITILSFKFMDIFIKLSIFSQLNKNKYELLNTLFDSKTSEIKSYLKYINVILFPLLFALSLN